MQVIVSAICARAGRELQPAFPLIFVFDVGPRGGVSRCERAAASFRAKGILTFNEARAAAARR